MNPPEDTCFTCGGTAEAISMATISFVANADIQHWTAVTFIGTNLRQNDFWIIASRPNTEHLRSMGTGNDPPFSMVVHTAYADVTPLGVIHWPGNRGLLQLKMIAVQPSTTHA